MGWTKKKVGGGRKENSSNNSFSSMEERQGFNGFRGKGCGWSGAPVMEARFSGMAVLGGGGAGDSSMERRTTRSPICGVTVGGG